MSTMSCIVGCRIARHPVQILNMRNIQIFSCKATNNLPEVKKIDEGIVTMNNKDFASIDWIKATRQYWSPKTSTTKRSPLLLYKSSFRIDRHNPLESCVMHPASQHKNSSRFAIDSVHLCTCKSQPPIDCAQPKTEVLCVPSGGKENARKEGKASPEQLENIYATLTYCLPRLFYEPHDYRLYSPNIIFEDHIRGRTAIGIKAYSYELSVLRLKGHLLYARIKLSILKATKHEEESCIKIRWQIQGISGLRIFLTFWRYIPLLKDGSKNLPTDTYDGFSTFYVNGEGKIIRHVCDKMMPDDEKVTSKNPLSKALGNLTA